jgi:hypothetical protein
MAKIYKIEPTIEHEPCDVYFGSTIQRLCDRMSSHRSHYRLSDKNNNHRPCNSAILFKKYGLENCNIILVEHLGDVSKNEMLARENEYINNNECINKYAAHQSHLELNAYKAAWLKAKYDKNKEEGIKESCDVCGSTFTVGRRKLHEKSKKHRLLVDEEFCKEVQNKKAESIAKAKAYKAQWQRDNATKKK